ncbi:MAG: 16S rRNA (adenine(1518)-N(6)/adenine(1519)-N(6))-dimethyltransferase RsmA [Gemmatimonadota bacterium]
MRRPAKRSLSQNFLVDPNLQRKIVEELGAGPADTVLEIGPGYGELSRHLVGRVARLVLVEKDATLAAQLAERWGGRDDVRVHEGDALALDLHDLLAWGRPFRILSNVPYHITSPLLFAFLALRPPAARIVVTVQKEVAERIVAPSGSRAYGALSVGVQSVADATLAFPVGRKTFRPVPEVDSAVVRIVPDPRRVERVDPAALRRVTRALFGRRRKQLQKILRSAPELAAAVRDPDAVCERLGVDPRARPETLEPDVFVRLAEWTALGGNAGGATG